jgi:hypothetical protein
MLYMLCLHALAGWSQALAYLPEVIGTLDAIMGVMEVIGVACTKDMLTWATAAGDLLLDTSTKLARLGGRLQRRLQEGRHREFLGQLGRLLRLLLLSSLRLARWAVAVERTTSNPLYRNIIPKIVFVVACDLACLHHRLLQAGPAAAGAAAAAARSWEPLLGALIVQMARLPMPTTVLVALLRRRGPATKASAGPLWERGVELVVQSHVHLHPKLQSTLQRGALMLTEGIQVPKVVAMVLASVTDVVTVLEASRIPPGLEDTLVLIKMLRSMMHILCDPIMQPARH